jgi:hypothetical protein
MDVVRWGWSRFTGWVEVVVSIALRAFVERYGLQLQVREVYNTVWLCATKAVADSGKPPDWVQRNVLKAFDRRFGPLRQRPLEWERRGRTGEVVNDGQSN